MTTVTTYDDFLFSSNSNVGNIMPYTVQILKWKEKKMFLVVSHGQFFPC